MNTRLYTQWITRPSVAAGLLCLLPMACLATDLYYINNGIIVAPPDPVPQVDAINFVNNSSITLSLSTSQPFETANTLNFTNRSLIQCNTGFRFVHNPTGGGVPGLAANFENTGQLFAGPFSHFTIWATNVICRGTCTIGQDGAFTVEGHNVNLRRCNVNLSPSGTFEPSGIIGTPSWTNGPGRIELSSDGTLDLTLARISGWNYMSLKATNHFQGSSNANIAVVMSDLNLRSTNGTLIISNLVSPSISWRGDIPSRVQDLSFTASTNVIISDVLNITRDFQINTRNLTITTNNGQARTLRGEIHLLSGGELLPAQLLLRNLTNHGVISVLNAATFGASANWYDNLVNDGEITTEGISMYAQHFQSAGPIDVGLGSFQLQAGDVVFSNSLTSALNGDVAIYASDLVISNHSLHAGRRLTIAATNHISDGVSDTNMLAGGLGGGSGSPGNGGSGLPSVEHDFSHPVPGVMFRPGRLLVRFAESITDAQRTQILTALGGGEVSREYGLVPGLCLVNLPAGQTVEQALEAYNQTAGISYAEPDYRFQTDATIPNDTLFNQLWGMNNTGQTGGTPGADINAPEAWDVATGSRQIIVAVIDTGTDYTHPDLVNNMWTNPGEIPNNGVDDDGNGFVDDVYGYDFVNGDADPMDDHGHGTHVSGTVGAEGDNGIGVVGVCWRVRIMAVKAFDQFGFGFGADEIASIDYATQMGARVMNASWGGYGYSQALKDAIDAAGDAGVVFAAAAGNGGADGIGDDNDLLPTYPASYDSDNIIAVMSTDHNDVRSSFSNYGRFSVDLGAPGSDILSCFLGGGYAVLNGTSMATPHVAGACALLLSDNPALTVAEVKRTLLSTVDRKLPGQCVSGGRLNIGSALIPSDQGLTNANLWVSGDGGFGLLHRATTGDLLGTTLLDEIGTYVEAPVSWAGEDRGAFTAGYLNNSAMGRLLFDADAQGLFHIRAVGSSNALYVDYLEFRNFATNRDENGNFAAFEIDPNMKVYYAEAVANGISIAEKLNGKNGGGFVWVPSYAGLFSSTNVVYPDGSVQRLNKPLVESCNLDSDGDGIVNCADTTPVFVGNQIDLTIAETNVPPQAWVLSWSTIPASRNSLLYKNALDEPTWQTLTNFTTMPGYGQTRVGVVVTNNAANRFYQVRIDAKPPE